MFSDQDYPLRGLCGEWIALLDKSAEIKHDLFGQYAKEAMQFFNGPHNFMWKQEYAAAESNGFLSKDSFGASGFPAFRMSCNRVFEAVALYGPSIYHRNPNIQVTPKWPPFLSPEDLGLSEDDPMQAQILQAVMQQQGVQRTDATTRGKLKQHYLNWLQQETDKKTHARRAIDEAVIKGMGCLWTGIHSPPSSRIRYPRSVFVSCDDILKDPDARYREDVQWIARKCCHPVNIVEKKYGYPEGYLRGTLQSIASRSTQHGMQDRREKRDTGTHDLLEYWEIYSKNGIGQRLKAMSKKSTKSLVDLTQYGEYCYLAVARDVPFPLNMPPDRMNVEAAQWPVPFWHDEGCGNGWPFAELAFYEDPESVWPISLIRPGIGELRFINWVMSYLADKVASSCTTYMAILKSAAQEIEDDLLNQRGPFKRIMLSVTNGETIDKIVQFLQAPDFSKDIWTMLSEVMEQFDKRTGLTELLYGQSANQLRSAEEARIKNQATTIRPDEMASKVEDWASTCAMKEMECAVYMLDREDFEPVLGQVGARVFEEKVLAQPFENVVHEFDYRVEAGSARKPNKQTKFDQLREYGQVIAPVLQQFAVGGQFEPWNRFARDMAEAMDLPDPDAYTIQQQPVEPGQGDPQAELELKQAELDMKMQSEEQKLQMQREKLGMELQAKQMEMQLKAQEGEQKLALNQAEFQQESAMKTQEHSQQMEISQANANQDMRLKEQQAQSGVIQSMAKNKIAVEESKTKQQVMKQTAKAKAKQSAKPRPKGK